MVSFHVSAAEQESLISTSNLWHMKVLYKTGGTEDCMLILMKVSILV